MFRSFVRALGGLAIAASALAVLPACTKTLVATYPGNNPVQFPWKSCGQDCVNAFAELQDTHDPTGAACDALLAHVDSLAGDQRAGAAAAYDAALVLILRGRLDDASARFAQAEALDPDPEYKQLEQLHRDSAAKYPVTIVASPPAAPGALLPPAAPAPVSSASAPLGTPAPPGPQPGAGPSPANSALLTPR